MSRQRYRNEIPASSNPICQRPAQTNGVVIPAPGECGQIRCSLSPITIPRRRPNPYFDPLFYREQNEDVRRANGDPLLHYIRYGERQRRQPVPHFDPAWYRATYGLADDEPCLLHFLERRHSGTVSPIAEF